MDVSGCSCVVNPLFGFPRFRLQFEPHLVQVLCDYIRPAQHIEAPLSSASPANKLLAACCQYNFSTSQIHKICDHKELLAPFKGIPKPIAN